MSDWITLENCAVYPAIYCLKTFYAINRVTLSYITCSLTWLAAPKLETEQRFLSKISAEVDWNGDKHIQKVHLGKHIIGYMVVNHVLRFRSLFAIKQNFQQYTVKSV